VGQRWFSLQDTAAIGHCIAALLGSCGVYLHLLLVIDNSMEPTALPACPNPPLLPLLYACHVKKQWWLEHAWGDIPVSVG
jgi:hypothetical protein